MKKRKVILICSKCFSRNYDVILPLDRKKRFEQKKHCNRCNKHTIHKESM